MVKYLLLLILFRLSCLETYALADGGAAGPSGSGCPVPTANDSDGMPLCPDVVVQDSAWRIWQCSYNDVKAWHPPTGAEKAASASLIKAWADERASGQSAALASKMIEAAKAMSAAICRAKSATDSYLVVNSAPGVRDYAGGNILLRESSEVSKLVMILPHSDSDGYYAAGPEGFAGTAGNPVHALAYVGNGHKRGNVSQGKDSDFVHHLPNLAYDTAQDIFQAYQGRYLLHLHGDQASTRGLMRPQDGSAYSKAYMAAVEKVTRVTDFGGLNAYFETDKLNFKGQVKSELPAQIFQKQHESIARIVNELEKSGFLWDSGAPPATVEVNMLDNAWAPPQKPFVGAHKVMCVAVQYESGPSATQAECLRIAQADAALWAKNSRGKLKLTPSSVSISWKAPAGPESENAIETYMRAKLTADFFLFPRLWYKGSSDTGDHVCRLTGYANWAHESGHALASHGLGLGHTGKYKPLGCYDEGKPGCTYDDYGDNQNMVMSDRVGSFIEASQYYYLGWLEDSEWTVYPKAGAQTYELKKLSDLGAKGLMTVFINPKDLGGQRPGFITYPVDCDGQGPCGGFYLMNGGGSAEVAKFHAGKDFVETKSGLHLTLLGGDTNRVKVQVSFDPVPVPSP